MTNDKTPKKQNQKAVALGYDKDTMKAPQIMAIGKGHVAERIMEIAREHNIPVERDPVLSEALSQLDLGQEIPPELYQVVAEILVFIMETDRKAVFGLGSK
jgi:flagellar biosynthesis protein